MMRELSTRRYPFGLLGSFRRDMDDLFDRFFGDWERMGAPWFPMSEGQYPQIESYVEGNTLRVKADLPGVDPKDVEVTVEGNLLTIKGERKVQHEVKDNNYLRQEVRYGTFARTFPLPEGVQADAVQAHYHNGVLEVAIPLPASLATKKIPIEIGSEERKQIAA